MIKKLISPIGIVLFSLIIVITWFWKGLLFAGAEEQLSFYNYTRSLNFFSYPWYAAGTGSPALTALPRIPYFLLFEPLYKLGISSVFLQAATFLGLILIGTISIYYLVKETLDLELKQEWKQWVPFLAAIFYLLNPFSMTQIWGRVLSYQIFTFALVPSFLLFFVLSLRKKNIIFCLIASVFSLLLSTSYVSPAVVITTWSSIGLYLIFYIFTNRKNSKNIFFGLFSFGITFTTWILLNLFWLYPLIKHGGEMVSQTLSSVDSVSSLKALAPNSHLFNVIRLIHREYYDGTYGAFYNSALVIFISWLLPIFTLFAIPILKKSKHFWFYSFLLIISIIICIGANLPTGPILIWIFDHFPLLQVLRNPYEKFGVNLVLAFAPFVAIGMLVVSEKFSALFKKEKLSWVFLIILIFLEFIVLVWPYWKGNFAGGVRTNFWVKVPEYYEQTNQWLNSKPGEFNILHLPLISEDGVNYTWEHPYEGIEPSEYMFDKGSISRNFVFNKDYYSVLIERFGITIPFTNLPNFSTDNLEFKDESLLNELSKLNVRFIILHHDTNYEKRRAISPQKTAEYLETQGIKKVQSFGLLDIYEVQIPDNIGLIYSPNVKVGYKKLSTISYLVDIFDAKGETEVYFLQQFHPSWQAFVDKERIENHSKSFSYANKWVINKTGNYQIIVKYAQQETVNFGTKISLLSGGVLALCLIFYFINKMRKSFL